jgi:uncharacterized protein HemX
MEVAARIAYEVVVRDAPLQHLLERHALALSDMRQLAGERVAVQNLERALAHQQAMLQQLAQEQQQLRQEQLQQLQRQQELQGGIDLLVRRNFWSMMRRLLGRRAAG